MKVSVVKCSSYKQEEVDQAIKKSLKLINFKINKGIKKVLLKPNILYGAHPDKAVTTHPSIIISLCKIFKGCKIFIGDSPGFSSNINDAFKKSGIEDAAKRYNAEILKFNTAKLTKFKNNKNKFLQSIYLPKIINEVDLIVNIPKLKTHGLMRYTGAIKNLYGFIPGGKKSDYHNIARTEEAFGELLVELYQFIKPQLTIMDGIIGMEGQGPGAGKPKRTELIIASKDCLSLDIVASEIIGFKHQEILSTKKAIEAGLFRGVKIKGEKDIKIKYQKIKTIPSFLPTFVKELIFRTRLQVTKKCKKCYICYNHCPTKAIKKIKDKELKINQKECIKCFCCQELCPYKAIEITYNPLMIIGKKILELLQKIRK